MTPELWLENVVAYSWQVLLVVAVGGALPFVFRLPHPRARFHCWQVLLAACVLLPAIQDWRPAPVEIPTVSMEPAEDAFPAGVKFVVPNTVSFAQVAVGLLAAGAGELGRHLVDGCWWSPHRRLHR